GSTSVGAESAEDESGGNRRTGATAGSARRAGQIPRISGETKSGVGVGPADGELVQHQLAQQHGARLAQLAHDRRVSAVAPARVQNATVRRRRRIGGGQNVLDGDWNALQRTTVNAPGELLVGSARGREGRLLGEADECADGLLACFRPREKLMRQLEAGRAPAA